ncbi:MAG: tetratricopeptide repeat protein, partial [Bacteroidia bacterium]|nr:tetratricopeptide repeat protein [Bacteroidia bacterium]
VKVVEGFVFFSFLLLFEFVLVLLDPQIEQYTGGEPIYKLIINACLAGLIFPLHQLFENKLTKRATRNKRKKWSSGVKGMMLIGLVTINSFSPLVANGRAYSIADSGAKMNALDSLEQQFVEAKSDSIKVLILLAITEIHMKASSQDAFTYGLQSLELSNKIGFNKGKAESLLSLAHAHDNDGNYEGAKQYCLQAIQVYQLDSNHNQVSRTLNFIGRINSTQGEHKNALEYKFKSLRILEDLGKKIESINLIAKQHISLGNTYKDLGNQDLAMNYYLKALKFFKELDDSAGIVSCFNKIGLAHLGTRDYDSSLKYHNRAYKIAMRNEDKDGIKRSLNFLGICLMSQDSFAKAIEYFQILRDIQLSSNNMMFAVGLSHNIATLYMLQGEIDIAIKTYKECIEISAMNDDKGQLIATLSNLSDTYATLGKLKLAESSLVKAYSLSQKSNSIIGVKKIALKLSKIYEKTHEYDNAYHYYMQYNTAKDSLFNEETSKAIGKLEAKYEFEKAEAERKQIELQQALIQAESIARRDNLQYSGAFIFIILILIVVGFSGWLHIPVKVAEGLVFFTFLLLFEFLLVYLDPYIEAFTSEPAIKLAINAALAGAIFPLHSFFESNLKKRIIKAQRKKIRIRMEQFRKDVEEL